MNKSAQNKMMDYLARRDHSELELRRKLGKTFSKEELDKAIDFAKSKKWIPETREALLDFSQKVAGSLHRKLKGILFINAYLKQKGLPPIETDNTIELEKARQLIKNKTFRVKVKNKEKGKEERRQISQFLSSRGFTALTIRAILFESKFDQEIGYDDGEF